MKARALQFGVSIGRMLPAVAVVAALAAWTPRPTVASTQIDIAGPVGSGAFGTHAIALPSGNIVVTDPYYDAGETQDVGAIYLYDGATGALISMLTGSTAGDRVGYGGGPPWGPVALPNGNYVVTMTYECEQIY
jgi:hypothetical protein